VICSGGGAAETTRAPNGTRAAEARSVLRRMIQTLKSWV
jgi:hypothetical protein